MKRFSIKLRVTAWFTLILLVISVFALWAVVSVSNSLAIRETAEKLTNTVFDFSHEAVGRQGEILRRPDMRFFDRGVYLALYDSSGSRLGGLIPYGFTDDIRLEEGMQELSYEGEKFMVCVKRAGASGSLWAVGAVSISDVNRMISGVVRTNLILTFILLIVAAAGGYLILRRALRPVDKITRTAAEISGSSDLSRRINLGSGRDEIYRLAETFDRMLDKIENVIENEKQFTSDASHELRTPVAVITSQCEYVLDCADSLEDAKESVLSIKRQSDRMSKLISELLTISRLDNNTQIVSLESIDVSELLLFVCDEQEKIHGGGITLIRSIQPSVYACTDRMLLARLFINLISNAYQYSIQDGRITVTLEKDGGNVVFSVSDNGIGIAEKDLPKIWERFYQSDPSRNNESGSMGLGLSMVRRIAERLGGTVSVRSKPGQGSTFKFVLPEKT